MKRKFKEIALISLPVIAVALAIPVFTYISRDRVHQEQLRTERQERLHPTRMQIESCQLKPSSVWDAYHGKDATLWTRSLAPIPSLKSSSHWRNVIEISDIYSTPVASFGRGGCSGTTPREDAQVLEDLNMLNSNEIFGDNHTVNARVIFEQTDDNCLALDSVSRDFVLQRIKTVPMASQRRSEFTIKKIVITPNIRGATMEYRLTFTLAALDKRFVQSPTFSSDGWIVRPKSGNGFVKLQSFGTEGGNIEKDGTTTFSIALSATDGQGDFAKYGLAQTNAKLPPKSASMDVLLSAEQGWPQQVHIELPQGLPPVQGKSAVLPFRSTLAPLPQLKKFIP